jgi:hypothetical protein
LVKKRTNFVERKNSFKNFEFAIRNFSPVPGSNSFCEETSPFCYKKVKQHGQGNFLEIFQKQFSYFKKESYEITEKAFFF